ncbi:MAG: hypothetical protein PHP62_04060 [Candidatus Moranbacteria bacterium]|nr:hypothetical protein [Candidatus Moranbacteria bacterium]
MEYITINQKTIVADKGLHNYSEGHNLYAAYVKALKSNHKKIGFDEHAENLLDCCCCCTIKERTETRGEINLVILTAEELGLQSETETMFEDNEIIKAGEKIGFHACPAEVGVELTLQYAVPLGEYWIIGMPTLGVGHPYRRGNILRDMFVCKKNELSTWWFTWRFNDNKDQKGIMKFVFMI